MQKISVVVIVRNEEKHIESCLASVRDIADEIIIMDNYSTDTTVEKCKKYTNKIFQQEFKGFGQQKQDAVLKASHEWVLQIDADEQVSSALEQEINQWKQIDASAMSGYSIPFHFYFMNHRMRFGGCAPEKHIRLFRKSKASYQSKTIHEGIVISGNISTLKNPITHYSYESFAEYLEKCNRYTTLIAREKYAQKKRFHFWHILRLPVEFIIRYIVKLGFFDGVPGLIYALLSSYYALMKHLKLLDIEKEAKWQSGKVKRQRSEMQTVKDERQ